MKSSIALVSDLVFSTFTCFLILSVLFGYFVIYPFSIILSVMGTALFLLFFSRFMITRYKKSIEKQKNEKEKQAVINSLNLMSRKELNDLIKKAIEKKDLSVEEKNDALFLPEKNAYVFLFFEFMQVKKADVLRAYNLDRNSKITILSGEFSAEIRDFVLQFGGAITLCDGNDVYSLLKETSLLPKTSFVEEKSKNIPFRTAFIEWSKKVNRKKFFLFGIMFLFFSYFAPIKGYYILCGSIFLSVSLICKLISSYQNS